MIVLCCSRSLKPLEISSLSLRLRWAYQPVRKTSQAIRAMSSRQPSAMESAKGFLSFVDASPTPYHAVDSSRKKLEAAGFKQIKERDTWSAVVKPGGKYYLTRNSSSIVAFAIGEKWKSGNPIAMVGAHTDSPCLRIKPVSKKQSDGYLQVGVETYGGGLWHTWFDRDLSIAGRIMVKESDGKIVQKLVKVDKPILRIPTLAIHLDRQESFSFNKESQLFPIAGLVAAELERQGKGPEGSTEKDSEHDSANKKPIIPLRAPTERHHAYVVEILAEEAKVSPEAIQDFEMVLYDTQRACLGGLNDEFIYSARLDNLMMSYCAVEGIIDSLAPSSALKEDSTIRLISLFDHEEIGSETAQGADSNLLPALIRRLAVLPPSESMSVSSEESYDQVPIDNATTFEQTLSTSFLLSADMAHSVHPNYPAKYESDHRPQMGAGPVIKINANARYATNSPGIVLLQEVAKLAKARQATGSHSSQKENEIVPLQLFVVRNDSSCGSTIGPMLAASLGARTLDLGNPQLSMHSIRETGGTFDVDHAIRLFESFFRNYGELEQKIVVD